VDAEASAPGAGPATGAGNAGTEAPALDLSNRDQDADISAYRARIADIQANDNPYSAALREQYEALGTLLQQTGEHTEAITAFESAMHIDRVNGGLYTLDQIPLVEKIIASHEALGNASEVNDFHGYLFYIQQKSFGDDDPRLLAAKEDWADWNLESYLKDGAQNVFRSSFRTSAGLTSQEDYVAVQRRDGSFTYVPRMQLLSMMNPYGTRPITDLSLSSGSYGVEADVIVDERLRTARDYYEQIIEVHSPDEDAASTDAAALPEKLRVQHKLADVAYAVKEQLEDIDMVNDPGALSSNSVMSSRTAPQVVTRGYTSNRDELEKLAQELEQDPSASVVEKAQAWIHLGDWHVGFDHASRSAEPYRKAWELLNAAGMDAAAIAAVFMPQPLIPAPAFATHPYSRALFGIDSDATLVYKGHMDLTLEVSRYGDVRGVEIDAASPNTPQALRGELLDFLREQKMRPAVVNGETIKRENLKLRYYYSY
jgi:tetratricopeptide (TPR) repeat protein